MFSLFGTKAERALVFHIGSASVGAGLVELERGASPRVIHSLREPIPYRDSVAANRMTADMLEALKKLNVRIAKEAPAGFAPRHVFYALSSPWTATQSKVVTIQEPKPFTLTKKHIDRIVAAQTKAAPGLVLFEKRVIDVRLNGYQVAEPYGKKAQTADVSLFMSFIPKALLDSVMEVSARTFHPRDTKLSSFALASFLAARDAFHGESDFILLDIGGELSDVSIVKDGMVLETASFPLGRHSLARRLQADLEVSAEEAVSLVRVYEDGLADENLAAGLKPVLDAAGEDWIKGFHQALASTARGMTLPPAIFLVVNPDFAKLFARILGADGVRLMDDAALSSSVSFADPALKDPFIAIAAAASGKLYESAGR